MLPSTAEMSEQTSLSVCRACDKQLEMIEARNCGYLQLSKHRLKVMRTDYNRASIPIGELQLRANSPTTNNSVRTKTMWRPQLPNLGLLFIRELAVSHDRFGSCTQGSKTSLMGNRLSGSFVARFTQQERKIQKHCTVVTALVDIRGLRNRQSLVTDCADGHKVQAGPALSRCNRCSCIGPRASGASAPWWLCRLFILARYSLRSILVDELINVTVSK